jgi:hypothetical protein
VPTVLRWEGYRFYFFSNEGSEPPHIHIDKAGNTAKYWLSDASLARNIGHSEQELHKLKKKVVEERERFLVAWNEYFGSRS